MPIEGPGSTPAPQQTTPTKAAQRAPSGPTAREKTTAPLPPQAPAPQDRAHTSPLAERKDVPAELAIPEPAAPDAAPDDLDTLKSNYDQALREGDYETAARAVAAMGNINSSDAVWTLHHIYDDAHGTKEMRKIELAAIGALGATRHEDAAGYLKDIARDACRADDYKALSVAVRALGKVPTDYAAQILHDIYDDVKRDENVGDEKILKSLRKAEKEVIDALGQNGTSDAVYYLNDILHDNLRSSAENKQDALEGLRHIYSTTKDPEVKKAAQEALE